MTLQRGIAVGIVLLLYATVSAAASEPKRVLILDLFGRDFAPWNEYATDTRAELLRQSPEPIDLYEASLATARFAGDNKRARSLIIFAPFSLVTSSIWSSLSARPPRDLSNVIGASSSPPPRCCIQLWNSGVLGWPV